APPVRVPLTPLLSNLPSTPVVRQLPITHEAAEPASLLEPLPALAVSAAEGADEALDPSVPALLHPASAMPIAAAATITAFTAVALPVIRICRPPQGHECDRATASAYIPKLRGARTAAVHVGSRSTSRPD